MRSVFVMVASMGLSVVLGGCMSSTADSSADPVARRAAKLVPETRGACAVADQEHQLTCQWRYIDAEDQCFGREPYCADPERPGCGDPARRAECLENARTDRQACLFDANATLADCLRSGVGVNVPFPHTRPEPIYVPARPSDDPCTQAYLLATTAGPELTPGVLSCNASYLHSVGYCRKRYADTESCRYAQANCPRPLTPSTPPLCYAAHEGCDADKQELVACQGNAREALSACYDRAREQRAACELGASISPVTAGAPSGFEAALAPGAGVAPPSIAPNLLGD